jgi:hypothetical protein
MQPTARIRLTNYPYSALSKMTYNQGEIVYDETNATLRLLDGQTAGGIALANQAYVSAYVAGVQASLTTSLQNYTDTQIAQVTANLSANYAPKNNPTFTGLVTGTFAGNVTGNISGNAGGNAATASQLATARNINGVAFDGTANVSVSTLVNGSQTVALASNGNLTIPGNIIAPSLFSAVGRGATNVSWEPTQRPAHGLYYAGISSSNGGTVIANTLLDNQGQTQEYDWIFGANGTLTAAGNITTPGSITAASAVINGIDLKRYVDSKVWLALAVGL